MNINKSNDDDISVSFNTGYYEIDTSGLTIEGIIELHEMITKKGLFFKRICIAMTDKTFENKTEA